MLVTKVNRLDISHKDFKIFDIEYPGGLKMKAHSDLYPKISIVIQGGLTESSALKHEEAKRLSMVFKAGDVIHENKFLAPNTRVISFLPELNLLEKYELTNLFDCLMWIHEGPVNILGAKMVNSYHLNDHTAVGNHFFSLLGHLSDFDFSHINSPPSWLKKVKEKLHDEFNASYSVENIAEYFGIHPVYLTRIFRQHFGCSITKYIRCLRVKKSAQKLIETSESLAVIALKQGFSDQSHFTRQFKDELGVTPGFYRKTFPKSLQQVV